MVLAMCVICDFYLGPSGLRPLRTIRPHGGRLRMCSQHRDCQAPVGVPRVPAPIPALQLPMKMVHPINALDLARLLQFVHKSVPVRVHIRADMMCHLASGMA